MLIFSRKMRFFYSVRRSGFRLSGARGVVLARLASLRFGSLFATCCPTGVLTEDVSKLQHYDDITSGSVPISELFCFLVSHKLGLPGFLRFVLSWSRTNLGFLGFWDPRLYQNVSVKGVDCVHALSKEVLNRRGITRRQPTARPGAHASIRAR